MAICAGEERSGMVISFCVSGSRIEDGVRDSTDTMSKQLECHVSCEDGVRAGLYEVT